jgi:hypothetical protein
MFLTLTKVCLAVSVACQTRLATWLVSRGQLSEQSREHLAFYVSSGIVADSYNDTPCQFTHWRPLGKPPS